MAHPIKEEFNSNALFNHREGKHKFLSENNQSDFYVMFYSCLPRIKSTKTKNHPEADGFQCNFN
jgi:hypothetical protein